MARKLTTEITSDLTGNVYSGEDVPQMTLSVNGKKGKALDLTPDECAALESFAIDGNSALLLALITPEPVPVPVKSGRKASSGRKGTDERNAAIREWAASPAGRKALGIAPDTELPKRGNLPRLWKETYDAAHAGVSKPVQAAPSAPEKNAETAA